MLDKEEGREAEDKEEFLALANGEPRSLSVESSRHQGGTALVILVITKDSDNDNGDHCDDNYDDNDGDEDG